ncbi:hypothetical protein [Dactylosporangium sp. CA-139066]|uniref:hypothetical protein n=1 Tax=Dactylosporangium sp. CA-139066 TaxID=3239930 RepID=UPI003D8B3BA8
MTSRDEQRRKRRSDSFRRDEADEADNWLAGLRGSGRGEPDPFAAAPPPIRPFDRPGPPESPDSFDRTTSPQRPRSDRDPFDSGSGSGPGSGSGEFRGSVPGSGSGSGEFRGSGSAPARGRRSRDDSPSGVFGPGALPPAPPPARPNIEAWSSTPDAPTSPAGGRRRAAEDDSPSGSFGRAAAESSTESRGRRRARDESTERRPSESYDHGPRLTPIIKPLSDLGPAAPSDEPPPLVPIFPNLRPDASPTSGAGRRARRAAEPDEPAAFTGDVTGGRRRAPEDGPGRRRREDGDLGPRTGDLGPRTGDVGSRIGDLGHRTGDLGPRTGDVGGGRRRGAADEPENGRSVYMGETTMFRPGDDTGARRRRGGLNDANGTNGVNDANGFGAPYAGDGPGPRRPYDEDSGVRRQRAPYDDEPRRARAGFEAAAPSDTGVRRREEALRRRPALDEPPQQRRALDDAVPAYEGYDAPPARRRGTGEYSGDFTSGGSRRALREAPGRPDRDDWPDRLDRPRSGGSRPGRPTIDPTRPGPRPHRWVALLSAVAVLVVLGACGMGTWFIFKDEKNGPDSAKSSAAADPKKRDISSRDVDPKPLTEAEVFPSNNIVAVPDEPPYVIMATKASNDCKSAATEQLATLLAGAGCTEVVRATMKSPNEEYLITAGIFNVTNEKVAAQTFDGIKPIVDGQKGRFVGMSVGAGTGTDALVRAPTQLGWNYKGHFITYCVIARVDGNNFAQGDPYPNQITYDIVETYLDNGIVENRAVIQPEATPAASLPPSAAPS